ncbi:UNVERIFIED_CONTAM: hypothetical protein Sradi_6333300 [Sesamum radiatum]|uniref:Uncharacterized protein n=1 Tax=Sesamum radiatum TaxID=300843 RepID=A0AAW2K3N3_SESRA
MGDGEVVYQRAAVGATLPSLLLPPFYKGAVARFGAPYVAPIALTWAATIALRRRAALLPRRHH